MVALNLGMLTWSADTTEEGHRNYLSKWLVQAHPLEGPAVVLTCPTLPAVGAQWNFGVDIDVWAWCRPNWRVTPIITNEPNEYWTVDIPFSTKPIGRCQDNRIEDPLLEPVQKGGTFIKNKREFKAGKDGPFQTSSLEPIRGPITEFDEGQPTVFIKLNSATLPLAEATELMDGVNNSTMWGLGARQIKLSNFTWSQRFYGQCFSYYELQYDFEINFRTFDRRARDEGTRVLRIGGDPTNPKDFIKYLDPLGEKGTVILDGAGNAWDGTGDPGEVDVAKYDEYDLLSINGIPATL